MAINAKDLTQKDELIAQLYTLKAGLSLIEEENKKIRQSDENIELIFGDGRVKAKIM